MTHLMTEGLIPTASGNVTLEAALIHAQDHLPIDSGEMGGDVAYLLMLSLLRDRAAVLEQDMGEYLQRHAQGFDLQGERPFLQVPERESRDLPWENPSVLMIKYASGQESTMLSPHLRSTLIPLTAQQALTHLMVTQMFGTARGKTKRQYSCNAPAANQVVYTLHGQTLGDDIELNSLTDVGRAPAHEGGQDWSQWRTRALIAQDATTTRLWPWKTVTLNFRGDTCNAVRLASGTHNPSETSDDLLRPPAFPYSSARRNEQGKGGVTFIRQNNPTSRETYTALCQTLLAALRSDAETILPLNVRRHIDHPRARSLRASAQITRPGKPVVLDLTQAELRLPDPSRADEAAHILSLALQGLKEVLSLSAGVSRPERRSKGDKQPERSVSYSVPRAYWNMLWPELNLAMQTLDAAEVTRSINRARSLALEGVLSEADHNYNPRLSHFAQRKIDLWRTQPDQMDTGADHA